MSAANTVERSALDGHGPVCAAHWTASSGGTRYYRLVLGVFIHESYPCDNGDFLTLWKCSRVFHPYYSAFENSLLQPFLSRSLWSFLCFPNFYTRNRIPEIASKIHVDMQSGWKWELAWCVRLNLGGTWKLGNWMWNVSVSSVFLANMHGIFQGILVTGNNHRFLAFAKENLLCSMNEKRVETGNISPLEVTNCWWTIEYLNWFMIFMCQYVQNGTKVHHREPNQGFSYRGRQLTLKTPSLKAV